MGKAELILINHYASIPRWPGPTRNFDFAAELVRLGWNVTLVGCKFNHYLRRYLENPPANENGVRFQWVWSTPYQGNSIQRELNIIGFSLLSLWRGLFVPGGIVLAVTPPLESACTAWLLSRLKGVPLVLDVEDLWPDSLISMGFTNRWVIGWLRGLERFLYRHSDHILVVADQMRKYLLDQGVPGSKISLIPLGANLPAATDNRSAIRAQYGWRDDQVIAVYVGAHGPANALETLIRAAQLLVDEPALQIVLFGDGSDKPRLQQLLQSLKLTNVRLADPVPPGEVPAILGAADIGIASLKDTPTFKTVRPNKIYEYMAAGLPIACCIDGEARQIVEEVGSGIFIRPEDDHGLAAQLRRLACDSEWRRSLGANGYRFCREEGDRRKLAATMGAVLEKVLERSSRR
jgi:glycosyltransferase involved in cell wall biosynthesis